ncbi:sigma-54-dependent Fis family transcriptional regulator [Nocardia xishanensis]|uniref:sigma-54-dependent Fis family transcriptional regulator n=1 Tax=Nocardia xishanensis TaxID=238964 RepID=UPI000A598047|nr:helix-turn-helix domain-containing protein [Nocardia xishanensis]
MSTIPGPDTGAPMTRPEIELSWKRSKLSGVEPEFDGFADLPVVEFDPASRLVEAAAPVLDRIAGALAGTGFSLLLADRDCRLVYRWFDDPRFESALDTLGIRDGAILAEEKIGTNALGTAIETRQGIIVHGAEHYIEPLKAFTCYGHPIRHPVTRRLEGVLDITGSSPAMNPLLAPFLVRAAEDIEQRLLDQAKASERALLAAFQSVSRQRRAVAAVGDDIILSNKSALDLLSPADYAVLRMLTDDLDSGARSTDLTLDSGVVVRAHLARIAGAGGGTLFHFAPIESPGARPVRLTPRRDIETTTRTGPVLIAGARGTGRSTEARRLAREDMVEFRDCADIAVEGEQPWVKRLRERLGQPIGTLCVENIDLLPEPPVGILTDAISAGHGPRLILTSSPLSELAGAHAALAAVCLRRVEMPLLRNRGPELAAIAERIVRELDPTARIRLLPSVIEVLSAQPWPGNLHELKAVLAHVVQRRHEGDVTVGDLPAPYRVASRVRRLSGRERAELDAIIEAMRRHKGNKLKAARDLGISRTTLYARLKALRITDGGLSTS